MREMLHAITVIRVAMAVVLVWLAALTPGSAAEPRASITMATLLNEMVDRDRLARLPEPAYTAQQFSSYERLSTAPDAPGWFANEDQGNFIRTEEREGRSERVMMDVDGPGAVTCFFKASTDPEAIVRMYLDGAASPVIEENLRYLLGGSAVTEQEMKFKETRYSKTPPGPQFLGGYGTIQAPLAGVQSLGCNLYLPIPYAKHCKITYDKPGKCYYRINCRTYASTVTVRTFTLPQLQENAATIARVGKLLVTPADASVTGGETRLAKKQRTLAAGESLSVTLTGPSAVRSLSVLVQANHRAQALRSTVLTVICDGTQTIWSPVGDFFGIGIGVHAHHGWASTVDADGTMSSTWVMPFRQECVLSLTNFGSESVEATVGDIVTSPWIWDDRSLYFNAQWHQQTAITTRRAAGTMDWNYVTVRGAGVYVGDTLTVYNGDSHWWGEGDEKIFVDGERFPSHFGTGTEDYYGYSRGGRDSAYFESPFLAHTQVEGDKRPGYTAMTRIRSLDAIPFTNSLHFDMEIWHWEATTVDYAVNVCWYGRPGTASNLAPAPAEAARPLRAP